MIRFLQGSGKLIVRIRGVHHHSAQGCANSGITYFPPFSPQFRGGVLPSFWTYIHPLCCSGRAVDGDSRFRRILPRQQWRSRVVKVRQDQDIIKPKSRLPSCEQQGRHLIMARCCPPSSRKTAKHYHQPQPRPPLRQCRSTMDTHILQKPLRYYSRLPQPLLCRLQIHIQAPPTTTRSGMATPNFRSLGKAGRLPDLGGGVHGSLLRPCIVGQSWSYISERDMSSTRILGT